MAHEDRVIEHLSKEIETQTNNLMTFRARINLSIFVGPFVVLGSLLVASKSLPRSLTIDASTIASLIALVLSYLVMGLTCAEIERHIWDQCNEWRDTIGRLTRPGAAVMDADLRFPQRLRLGYAVVYIAMLVAVASTVVLLTKLNMEQGN